MHTSKISTKKKPLIAGALAGIGIGGLACYYFSRDPLIDFAEVRAGRELVQSYVGKVVKFQANLIKEKEITWKQPYKLQQVLTIPMQIGRDNRQVFMHVPLPEEDAIRDLHAFRYRVEIHGLGKNQPRRTIISSTELQQAECTLSAKFCGFNRRGEVILEDIKCSE